MLGPLTIIKKHLYTITHSLGGFTPSYILHTRVFGTYLLGEGVFTLQKRL
jgi:hypothetical protein